MAISLNPPHYNFIEYENVKSIEFYNKFINWTKGEFDLHLIEESDELKVYYPNGWFIIKVLSKDEKGVNIIIKITSKTLNSGLKIDAKIKKIYSHLKQISPK